MQKRLPIIGIICLLVFALALPAIAKSKPYSKKYEIAVAFVLDGEPVHSSQAWWMSSTLVGSGAPSQAFAVACYIIQTRSEYTKKDLDALVDRILVAWRHNYWVTTKPVSDSSYHGW